MIKRVCFFISGLLLATLGVVFLLSTKVGAPPWDATFAALHRRFGLTVGTWVIIINVLFALLTAFLMKRRPKFESAITIILWGGFVDLWLNTIFKNMKFTTEPYFLQIIIFIIGLILLGFGIGVYLVSKFPEMPVDELMLALMEKYKLSLKKTKISIEATGYLLAVLLKGPIGIGSVVLVVFLGQIVQYSNQFASILYNKLKM